MRFSSSSGRRAASVVILAVLGNAAAGGEALAEWPSSPATCVPVATAPGTEEIAHVAPDGLGGMLVVWTNSAGGDSDVFAQRVDESGTPLWGTSGVTVAQETDDQHSPQIVDDGTGGAIIVWTDDRNSGATQSDIYAQRVLADGTIAWTAGGVVVCDQFNDQLEPRITTDGMGGAILIWRDARTGQARVWGQRLDGAGMSVWTEDGIDFSPGSVVAELVIASDGAGGAFAAWDNMQVAQYMFQHVNADGTFQLPAGGEIVSFYYGGSEHSAPSITADGFGGFWIAFAYFDMIDILDYAYAFHYTAENELIAGSGVYNDTDRPHIVPDGGGGVIVAWHQSFDVRVTRLDPGGSPLFTFVLLDVPLVSGGEERWDIVPDFAGGAIVTTRGSGSGPQVVRVAPDGTTPWGNGNPGLKLAFSNSAHPRAVPDRLNGAIVVWTSGDPCAARADRHGYVGNPRPFVTEADDIPGDQGGSILVSWDPSPLDVYPNQTVVQYAVWRQAPGAARSGGAIRIVSAARTRALERAATMGFDRAAATDLIEMGWEPVGSLPAAYQLSYALETETYADSTVQGPSPMNVKVFAQTSDAFVFWESNVATGQSIDNLAPGAPLNATVMQGGVNTLRWEAPYAPDLSFYRVYRGLTPDFPIDAASFVAAVTELEWVDVEGGAQYVYKITAVDDAWNESAPTSPDVVVDTPTSTAPARFALHRNWPNPFNPKTNVRFDLAAYADRVTVRIYDATGRIVRLLHDGAMSPGSHTMVWDGRDDARREVSSGVYYLELVAGSESSRVKMVMLE